MFSWLFYGVISVVSFWALAMMYLLIGMWYESLKKRICAQELHRIRTHVLRSAHVPIQYYRYILGQCDETAAEVVKLHQEATHMIVTKTEAENVQTMAPDHLEKTLSNFKEHTRAYTDAYGMHFTQLDAIFLTKQVLDAVANSLQLNEISHLVQDAHERKDRQFVWFMGATRHLRVFIDVMNTVREQNVHAKAATVPQCDSVHPAEVCDPASK